MRTKTLYVCEVCSGEYQKQEWAEQCEKEPVPEVPPEVKAGAPVRIRLDNGTYVWRKVIEADVLNSGGLVGRGTVPGHTLQIGVNKGVRLSADWNDEPEKYMPLNRIVSDADAKGMTEFEEKDDE